MLTLNYKLLTLNIIQRSRDWGLGRNRIVFGNNLRVNAKNDSANETYSPRKVSVKIFHKKKSNEYCSFPNSYQNTWYSRSYKNDFKLS